MINFIADEFKCKCGKCTRGYMDMTEGLTARLDIARSIAGIPFVITSAVRCADRNSVEGGKSTSSHLSGHAVDIKAVGSRERFIIMNALIRSGFKRIGIGEDFIHCDDDPGKPSMLLWLY